MRTKKNFLSVGLMLAMALFISHGGWAQTRPETKAPIITNAYAIDRGRYGSILKIYIEADDPDGDMLRIATVVDQVGRGSYPTDWTYLKPQNQHHLIGYLQWNTFSVVRRGHIPEWTNITIKVSIFDKSGNESNEVVFPFTFETGTGPEPKPRAPFDQGNIQRLGYVMSNLEGAPRFIGLYLWC